MGIISKLKVLTLLHSYTQIILGRAPHELNPAEIEKVTAMSRPLTRAWFSIEQKRYLFEFKRDMARLLTGLAFNIASIAILFGKIHFKLPPTGWYTATQLLFSFIGLILIFTGLGLRGKDKDDRALEFIREYNPMIFGKITRTDSLLTHYDPSVILNYYSPNSIGFPADFTEEIAGLLAIGGIGNVPVPWLVREETLFIFCGSEEYIEERLVTEVHFENFRSLKLGFNGTVDQLIEVSKRI